ncbi:MAG: NAD(+) synthase, partial [Planctomycetota bacterium]
MKIAIAQLNPTVGDLAGNARLIETALAEARDREARVAVFPELAVSGYPPRDLLMIDRFVDACERTARSVGVDHTDGIAAVIGTPIRRRDGTIANGLLVYLDGHELARYEKRLLPTYDVFDEDRYFEPGDSPSVFEVDGHRIGLAVCEDLWRGEDAGAASRYRHLPGPIASYEDLGLALLAVPSASPFVLGKHRQHHRIVHETADRLGVPVVSVNQAGANDDLIFDGRSCMVSPGGRTLASAARFEPELLICDLDGDIEAAHDVDDERLLIEALTAGTRDYLGKSGFASACLGLSGGIDSALTAAIAVRAIGAEHVTGASMPGPFSSEGSITDALELAGNLGMRCISMPISDALQGHQRILDGAFGALGETTLGAVRPDLTEENLQSRVRGALMMGLSNRTGSILLTTGNKSELAVGYCTLYGDMNGGLAVIS